MKASKWVDVSCETLSIGEIVRVKLDAYSTNSCLFHNGRLVKVTNISGGDVYVTSIDYKTPFIKTARHSPYKLEKAVG